MILVGVGGDGERVSLVLTGRDTQLAKEIEPLDAIRLAHRLLDEALRIHNKTPLAEAGGASGKGVINAKGYDGDITRVPVSRKRSEEYDARIRLPEDERVELRRARYQKRIGCKAMAHRLGLPVTTFSNYECGDRRVPSAVLDAWRQALGRE
jgi:hypothetical protein